MSGGAPGAAGEGAAGEGTAGAAGAAALPERIGRYPVRALIGAGGFATVYRAVDDRLDTDVAVKVLAENHSLEPDVRRRFIEEGRRLRRVRSPHVVTVHELGETDRAQPYLVLDWADRGDLARRVAAVRAAGSRPGPDDALVVADTLAGALGVLHAHRLVHRDLAPRNLLLCSMAPGPGEVVGADSAGFGAGVRGADGGPVPPLVAADERLVLADLGVSKDLAVASGLTVAAGTSGFAPPEQRRAGEVVDHRADVWAASALLVWLAIDRPPDDEGRWRAELRAAGWPPAFVATLGRGLAERPADRHPSIGAWHDEVRAALASPVPAPAPGPGVGTGGAVPAEQGGATRWRRAALGAGVAAAALAVVVLLQVLGDGGGPSVRTQSLDDGRERTVVTDDGITVALTGPSRLAVDESAILAVEVEGADTWVWIAPGDEVYEGGDTLQLTPRSPGTATVRVLAVDGGRMVEARRRVEVTVSGPQDS